MPEPLPHRKVGVHERAIFESSKNEIVKKRKAEPSRRPDPKRVADHTPGSVIARFREDLSSATNELKEAVSRGSTSAVSAAENANYWRAVGGDLAGALNDSLLALDMKPIFVMHREGEKYVPSTSEYKQFLDLLSLAGEDWDVHQWLDQWRNAAESGSFDRMAEAASAIKGHIQFTKTLLDRYIKDLFENENTREKNGDAETGFEVLKDEISRALDGVGAEIARQSESILAGGGIAGAGGVTTRAHSLGNASRRNCDRTRNGEQAVKTVVEFSIGEVSFATLNDLGSKSEIARKVRDHANEDFGKWNFAAKEMHDMLNAMAHGDHVLEEAQIEMADELNNSIKSWIESFATIVEGSAPQVLVLGRAGSAVSNNRPSNNFTRDIWAKDSIHAAALEMLSSMAAMHYSFQQKLSSGRARRVLKEGVGFKLLGEARTKFREAMKDNTYAQARAVGDKGKLHEFWTKHRDDCQKKLQEIAKDKAFGAIQLEAAVALAEWESMYGDAFGVKLDAWAKRAPEDIPGLAWQLIATIRKYKRESENCLGAGSALGRFMTQTLDGIMMTIQEDLAHDIAAGRL